MKHLTLVDREQAHKKSMEANLIPKLILLPTEEWIRLQKEEPETAQAFDVLYESHERRPGVMEFTVRTFPKLPKEGE